MLVSRVAEMTAGGGDRFRFVIDTFLDGLVARRKILTGGRLSASF
jgi:hypothetical protein